MSKLFVIVGLFVLAGLCEIGGGYLVEGWIPSSASTYYSGSVIETPTGSGQAGETRG